MANGPLLGFLAPLPLMMAGLWGGRAAAAIAVGTGMAAVTGFEGVAFGLSFLAMACLPSLVVSERALLWRQEADGGITWYPAGRVLAALTTASGLLFLTVAALLPPHADGIRGWMAETLSNTLAALGGTVPDANREAVVQALAGVLPAVAMGGWLTMALVNAMAAQALLRRMKRNRRPSPDYLGLDLPDWMAGVLVGTATAGILLPGDTGYVAANLAALMLVPFGALGVASTHRYLAKRPGATFGLIMLYGTLALVLVWVLIPAAALGFVTYLYRRRPKAGDKEESDGSHSA